MDCHIEVFADDAWHNAARVSFSDIVRAGFRADDCIFEHAFDYVFGTVRPPISLSWPVDTERHRLAGWPAFLYDLVPDRRYGRTAARSMTEAGVEADIIDFLLPGIEEQCGQLLALEQP